VHTGTLPDRSWYRSRMPTGVTLVLLLYARALVCTGRCYVLLFAAPAVEQPYWALANNNAKACSSSPPGPFGRRAQRGLAARSGRPTTQPPPRQRSSPSAAGSLSARPRSNCRLRARPNSPRRRSRRGTESVGLVDVDLAHDSFVAEAHKLSEALTAAVVNKSAAIDWHRLHPRRRLIIVRQERCETLSALGCALETQLNAIRRVCPHVEFF
jgi:hypothetical protein